MPSAEPKDMLRSLVRAARRQGPPADPDLLAQRCVDVVDGLAGPLRVTCYSSYGFEPATAPLLAALLARGYEVLLPRVVGTDLEWVPQGGATALSSMGIEEPTGEPAALLPLRAMLVPALAVDADGVRLGKGGGFYDRTIATLAADQRPVIAALVRDDDVMPAGTIPRDAHDQRVDIIITPTRVISCASD